MEQRVKWPELQLYGTPLSLYAISRETDRPCNVHKFGQWRGSDCPFCRGKSRHRKTLEGQVQTVPSAGRLLGIDFCVESLKAVNRCHFQFVKWMSTMDAPLDVSRDYYHNDFRFRECTHEYDPMKVKPELKHCATCGGVASVVQTSPQLQTFCWDCLLKIGDVKQEIQLYKKGKLGGASQSFWKCLEEDYPGLFVDEKPYRAPTTHEEWRFAHLKSDEKLAQEMIMERCRGTKYTPHDIIRGMLARFVDERLVSATDEEVMAAAKRLGFES
jgi:hypothetical protein